MSKQFAAPKFFEYDRPKRYVAVIPAVRPFFFLAKKKGPKKNAILANRIRAPKKLSCVGC